MSKVYGNRLDALEIDRIKEVYAQRKKVVPEERYSFFSRANLFIVQTRERAILNLLDSNRIAPIKTKVILDVGCGKGQLLREFIKYGARPKNLYGVDLVVDRSEEAKSISPNIDFRCVNAEKLPYENNTFDLALSFTLFTSILNEKMKQNIAFEMLRVLKPEGFILWYDFHINNPKNPDVRGIKRKEIYELFPNCEISLEKITLAPPLTRAIAPYSWLACYLLEKIPLLRTHYLGIIKKACV